MCDARFTSKSIPEKCTCRLRDSSHPTVDVERTHMTFTLYTWFLWPLELQVWSNQLCTDSPSMRAKPTDSYQSPWCLKEDHEITVLERVCIWESESGSKKEDRFWPHIGIGCPRKMLKQALFLFSVSGVHVS